jgi:cell division protein FtsW (lipid II flippase)
MTKEKPRLAIVRHGRRSHPGKNSSNKLLKTALWFVWLPILVVLWVMLLDTSYDWISSPSTTKVIGGLLILILMGCVVIGLVSKGAKKLWTR